METIVYKCISLEPHQNKQSLKSHLKDVIPKLPHKLITRARRTTGAQVEQVQTI